MARVTRGNTPLPQLLRDARGELSMRELARRSGLSAAQISRIEGGEVGQPSAETLTRIALALDRDAELLLIAAGRVELQPAVFKVRFILQSLAGADDSSSGKPDPALTQTLREFEAAEGKVNDLQVEGIELDSAAAGYLEVLDSWRVDRAETTHIIEGVNERLLAGGDEAMTEDDREVLKNGRAQHELADKKIAETEQKLATVRVEVQEHQASLDAAERELDDLVRACAAELFLRGDIPRVSFEWLTLAPPRNALAFDPFDPSVLANLPPVISHRVRADERHLVAGQVEGKLEVTPEILEMFSGEIAQVEKSWREARNRLLQFPEDRDFRTVARHWERLTDDRRRKVLEFVEDQRRLSVQEELQADRDGVQEALREKHEELRKELQAKEDQIREALGNVQSALEVTQEEVTRNEEAARKQATD